MIFLPTAVDDRGQARPHRRAVDVHRARAALAEAAAELRAGVSACEDPERSRLTSRSKPFAVHFKNHGHIIQATYSCFCDVIPPCEDTPMTRRELLLTMALCTNACRTAPQSATVTLAVAGMI